VSTEQLWLGALTDTSITAVAKLNLDSTSVVLACRQVGTNTWVRSSGVASAGGIAKITVTGLTANTAYTCRVEPGTKPSQGVTGSFTTYPSGSNVSFTMALIGDASELSNHAVFDAVRTSGARSLIHLGDMHYNNLTINDQACYRTTYDEVFAQSRQHQLYRTIPSAYVWDDHDYGPNNSDGSSPGHDAACAVYRARVPHYPLVDTAVTAPIHQTWDIGRVRFIMTDQRSAASLKSATDNSSKTMLGAAQKTWFKNLIANSSGKMIVWVCSRMFGGVTETSGDHWGGFATERKEIVDHIKTNAHGRLIVLSADMHAMRIGSHDFATGGGEALPTFQVATLDRAGSIDTGGYGGVSSTGATQWQAINNIFGVMQITDTGGATIGVSWQGFNSSGSSLFTAHTFSVTP
jgi:phosphodiesterase/alkaline phosphatase D-like protein